MKDKEKQIEEMAKVICGACLSVEEPCYMKNQPCSIATKQAKVLYNAGYRKLPKDSVVLSREEYERLKEEVENKQFHCDSCERIGLTRDEHIVCINQARKETAEKFANELKSIYEELDEDVDISVRLIREDIDCVKKNMLKGDL